MGERRLRTAQLKKRQRRQFWQEHGEKVRLFLIGGGIVLIVSIIAEAMLR